VSENELRPGPEEWGHTAEGAWPVDHTADLALRVRSRTLEGLFRHAALGMTDLALGGQNRAGDQRWEIRVSGLDFEELLVAWLSELLYQGDTRGRWIRSIEHLTLTSTQEGCRLAAGCRGGRVVSPAGGASGAEIKAVTYHGLRIDPADGDGYDQLIVFDT
jgi:SHS2 domain-containing protein